MPRIDIRALLGLHDPADSTDWGPIRAAQLQAGGQLAIFLFAANVLAAALVAMMLATKVPLWQLAGWGALVAVVGAGVAFRRLSARNRATIVASVGQVRDTMLDGIALAAIWSIPPLAFGATTNTGIALGLWVVIAVLMAASAVAMAALPLTAISFTLVLGCAVATMMWFEAGPLLAATSILYAVLVAIGCFSRARALVVIRASEIALAERDETVSLLLREFEEHGADWLWATDTQRRVVHASARFAAAVGLNEESINGMPLLQILAGPTWNAGNFSSGLRALAEKLKGRDSFRDLLLPVIIDGQERWWEIAASPRFDGSGVFVGFRGVSSDVTEARASADKINRMARFDPLTGLPNRLLINETLGKAMAQAQKWGSRCAFMMIDLDRFKAVNDTLGHPLGDKLLSQVSERLGELMTGNEMIGRLGGDEFAVVVLDAGDQAKLEELAQTIIQRLSEPYEVEQHTLYIGASIGLAFGPRDGETVETLIRSADLALYRSKDAGGGVLHIYEQQLHMAAEERRKLELALRRALERGELSLMYQPVVKAGSGKLTGFEALLRWTHPEFGSVSPVKFIPIAEEARLIGPIGEWVLRSACAEAASWNSSARVAVNVSPEQLHNPAFVTVVTSALANSGLSPDRLELEVTESVFMHEGTCAVQVLERILDLGVRLSLDDFGTGYSSLGYLSRTRFSSIKIDRSFVRSASKGESEAIAIIRAVVALAESLGMGTTAEGVETEDEHEMIQRLGCTKVQGYYFGRPLLVEEARAIATRDWSKAAAA
jgi:diguanylate cyclase (GGDEF)-like protein/PAS domain S-box-containing protein